ncbi:MAG: molybdopterin oxidoreductase family protein [Gemmataceae bacterium]|nr:molybdopterin oxidoreductase family protein [Gemmataceae bacterium]
MATSLKTVHAVCPHDCPDTCSILVSVRDGVAIGVKGDSKHPFTKGFLCGKVARYHERTYHPSRVLHPLVRTGSKGQGQFKRISWPEAIALISGRLKKIIQSPDGPEAILPYSYAGTMGRLQGSSLDRRFFHLLGASLLDRTICATAGVAGSKVTLGTRAAIDPDSIRHSRLIVNWGSNTSVTNSHLWVLMHKARQNGARIITIDPFQSKTAEKSDWWIPIRPGTDAALALGLMHIIFRDHLEDTDYLREHCLGGEELRARVLRDYAPEQVAGITSLTKDTIEKLAREYATTYPALIRLNYGLQRHGGGGMAVRTITCLPAVTGAWKHPGGGAFLSTSAMYPLKNQDKFECHDLVPQGTRTVNMTSLAEALTSELPPPEIKALVVYNANPATVCPDQARVIRGLKREDLFTVVLEQFPTDTTDYADVVLPATTQLEHLDLHTSYGHLFVGLNEPAIAPLGEAKPNTEIFRLLARGMDLPGQFFQATDEELVREALEPNPESLTGAGALNGITLEALRENGFLRLNLPADYSPFSQGKFPTPSGKCELHSPAMENLGMDPLPYYHPPHEDPQTKPELASRFPLQLLTPPDPAFLNSSFANLESQKREAGQPTVFLHARDAAARGIQEGFSVRIFNTRGEYIAVACVSNKVQPGVAVAQGLWWNKDLPGKANCNHTTSSALTDLGAGATFFDNLVEIEIDSTI